VFAYTRKREHGGTAPGKPKNALPDVRQSVEGGETNENRATLETLIASGYKRTSSE
jgi:hypothetical protein